MESHVVFFPYPLQGHIQPMLKLAELLIHEDFRVTFVNTDKNHDRILSNADITSFYNRFPKFIFRSIPDGLPSDYPSSGLSVRDILDSMKAKRKQAFRDLLISIVKETRRPTCIITDGIMSFVTVDVAQELEIPVIAFRTLSASCTWTYFHLSKLIQEGEHPFSDENMDKLIPSIPGFENVFRRRDLPGVCRVKTSDDECVLQSLMKETSIMTRASALILNTCDEIETPAISKLGSYFTKIYTIGPVHELHRSLVKENSPLVSSNGTLHKEDSSCMQWLDSQPSRSVLYVSFGSLIRLTQDQMLEFWHGIVNSGKLFFLVIRSDLILGESETNMDLQKETPERGYIVSWAPQEEILAHPAIGGFLTHSGWNSTLESITAGVPMICWPRIADQQVNSRCVSEIWKNGFDMKDTCDRLMVEKLVRDLMENKREDIMESTNKIARMAGDAIKEDGSSYRNLKKLIEDIRSMTSMVGILC